MRLRGTGRVAGQLPEPYWLSYLLETDDRARTTRLEVTAKTAREERRLELRRGAVGWTANGDARPDLDGALDCDIAASPLTNAMPIIRHRLGRAPLTEHFLMAFVEVPNLRVTPARQVYQHLDRVEAGARVRYSSGSFSSDLLVDDEGFVLDYPGMAHRVPSQSSLIGHERVDGPGSSRPSAS